MKFEPSHWYDSSFELARQEMRSQNKAHGNDRDIPALLWSTLISEEAGEIAKECIDSWQSNSYSVEQLQRITEEATQLAALSLQLVAWSLEKSTHLSFSQRDSL